MSNTPDMFEGTGKDTGLLSHGDAVDVLLNQNLPIEDNKEVSKEELTDFIESMDSRQFSKVKDFIQEIPKLRHSYDIECGGCKENIKGDMEGLANFLS